MKTTKYLLTLSIFFQTTSVNFGINTLINQDQKENSKHKVGELFGGGIVFFVDGSGEHGLICSLSDIQLRVNVQAPRQNTSKPIDASPTAINTEPSGQDAIRICDNYFNLNYGTGVFSDWYLPTIEELETLYKVKDLINKIIQDYDKNITDSLNKTYWSSSKTKDNRLGEYRLLDINYGNRVMTNKPRPGSTGIRAVRSF